MNDYLSEILGGAAKEHKYSFYWLG